MGLEGGVGLEGGYLLAARNCCRGRGAAARETAGLPEEAAREEEAREEAAREEAAREEAARTEAAKGAAAAGDRRSQELEAAREVRRRHRAMQKDAGTESAVAAGAPVFPHQLIEDYEAQGSVRLVDGTPSRQALGNGAAGVPAGTPAPEAGARAEARPQKARSMSRGRCASNGRSSARADGRLDHPTTRRVEGPVARRKSADLGLRSALKSPGSPRSMPEASGLAGTDGANGSIKQLTLRAGHLVLGAPLRQGQPSPSDLGLGLVCAVSEGAYHLRFMWRHPLDSPLKGGEPVGVCDNLRIDRRDMIVSRYARVRGAPPPPYLPGDREVLEGGQLAAEASGFRWRRLQSDAADALGLPPPDVHSGGVYS